MQALIADKFDPDKVDALLRNRKGPPKWLTPLIADRAGRELIYTLSARYKNCQLLKYAMQRILMAGHHDEVASVGSRLAGYFEVFHNLMVKRLEEMLHVDDGRMQVLSRELMVGTLAASPDCQIATQPFVVIYTGASLIHMKGCCRHCRKQAHILHTRSVHCQGCPNNPSY